MGDREDAPATPLEPGTALCLSGGGFRAMLFHVGGLRRLDELGLLDQLDAVSSVSGGSITSGVMSMHLDDGALDVDAVERTLFDLAGHTLDVRAMLGAWVRFRSVSAQLARIYDRQLFHGRSLQDLPDAPRFVFNTTNMHTGNSLEWSKRCAHDYALGDIERPDVPLATVVAASSAFPPVLSPSRIAAPGEWVPGPGTIETSLVPARTRSRLWLTDGGVYDNLGLQPVDDLETLLVSDGGAPFVVDKRLRSGWFSLTMRTLSLLQDQVGKRRRYEELYAPGARSKVRLIWSARHQQSDEHENRSEGLPLPAARVHQLGATHTRLAALPERHRYQLMNLGYALADRTVRPRLRPTASPPTDYPYPGGLG